MTTGVLAVGYGNCLPVLCYVRGSNLSMSNVSVSWCAFHVMAT
jgi:hypothetical protein